MIGAVVLAVVVAAVVIIAAVKLSGSRAICDFDIVEPTSYIADLQNIPSDKFDALASFSGYFETRKMKKDKSESRFLSLELQNVTWFKSGTKPNLTLWTSCAQIILNINVSNTISVDSILVNLTKPNGNDDRIDSCVIEPTGIVFRTNSSYSCLTKQRFDCHTADEKGSNMLVIDSLQFEIDGDRDTIKKREFSKPVHYCV